ncbi:MAG: tol-pal system protein YbgF [Pseudomonadota bacterium]|nr:tol-pal system protein YbgF [Pseudomonadota bacterium]
MIRSLRRPTAIAGLLAAIAASVATLPARAQDQALLQDRIQRLERSVNDLKAMVFAGRGSAGGAVAPAAAQTAPLPTTDQADAAGLGTKINALEAEVRALTNRTEEIDFKLRRIESRLDKLVEDVDFRLLAIERNLAAAPPPPSDGATATAGAAPAAGPGGTQILGHVTPQELAKVPPVNTAPARNGSTATAAAATSPARPIATALPEGEPKALYDQAFALLQARKFDEAETAFATFMERHPEHELAGNAQYWLGETYYVRGRREQAAQAFLDGYQKYRNSSKAPDNLLKLGITLVDLNQVQDACAVFAELADRYPGAAPSIKRRLQSEKQKANCA